MEKYLVIGVVALGLLAWKSQNDQKAQQQARDAALRAQENSGINGFLGRAGPMLGGATGLVGALGNAIGQLGNLVNSSGGETGAGGSLDQRTGGSPDVSYEPDASYEG